MKICMIGTGYVGLVSGSCFADLGNTVLCVDKDVNKILQSLMLKENKLQNKVYLKSLLNKALKFYAG